MKADARMVTSGTSSTQPQSTAPTPRAIAFVVFASVSKTCTRVGLWHFLADAATASRDLCGLLSQRHVGTRQLLFWNTKRRRHLSKAICRCMFHLTAKGRNVFVQSILSCLLQLTGIKFCWKVFFFFFWYEVCVRVCKSVCLCMKA